MQESVPDDSRSAEEHYKAIQEEMRKAKPRYQVLLPLMKSTFHDRRIFVQNDAKTVACILNNHPALVQPTVVCKLDYDCLVAIKLLVRSL